MPYEVATLLQSYRFRLYSDEIELHEAIGEALQAENIAYQREYRLSKSDRLDFFLPLHGIALEVKIKGRAADVLRQLSRYAESETVKGLLLVTTRNLHAMQMPANISGKPLAVTMIGGL
jgi:hypothetical protein